MTEAQRSKGRRCCQCNANSSLAPGAGVVARADEVLAGAAREQRVLVTTDTDFGTILALSGAAGPSVMLLRGIGPTFVLMTATAR